MMKMFAPLPLILALGLSITLGACREDKEVAINAPPGTGPNLPKLGGPGVQAPVQAPPTLRIPPNTGLFVLDEGEVTELRERGRPQLTGELLLFILHDPGAQGYSGWDISPANPTAEDTTTSHTIRVTPLAGRDDVLFVDTGTTLALGLHKISATTTTGTLERAFHVESLDMRDARYFVKNNQMREAMKCLEDAIKADPDYVEAYVMRAAFHSTDENAELLEADARTISRLAPDRPDGFALLAQAHLLQGESAMAFDEISKAIAISEAAGLLDSDSPLYYFRARLHWRDRNAEAALADATKALDLAPDFPSCLAFRANLLFGAGEFNLALADLDRAIKLTPEFNYARILRSHLLRYRRRYNEALKDVEAVLATEPNNPEAVMSKSIILTKQGMHPKALVGLDAALAISPNNADLLLLKAWVTRETGDFSAAIELYDRAAAAKPDLPYAWSGRVPALVALGRREEAMEAADKAFGLATGLSQINRADVIACRAEALWAVDRKDEALAALDEAKSLSPEGEEVLRVSAIINAGAANP